MNLGLIAVLAIWLLTGGLMLRSQARFLREYSRKLGRNDRLLFHEAHIDRPWTWFSELRALMRANTAATEDPVDDPDLEQLRKAYVLSRWVFLGSFVALIVIGFVFFSSP